MAQDADKLLGALVDDVRNSFRENRTIMSFREYFRLVLEEPERQLRSAAQYVVDMLQYFGREELNLPTGTVTRFKVFDAPFAQGEGRVAGQELVQEALYRILADFAREGRVNKLILLHGPNGSAKSSIVRCLMEGLEAYGRLPEGANYSFNWIFPSAKVEGSSIGFGAPQRPMAAGDSFAYLPAEAIDARVPCGMHDHPLFLIPRDQRRRLLRDLLPDGADLNTEEDGHRTTLSDYLLNGDLSHKSRAIYDALLTSYDGDVSKVLNHVQIERFYVSRRYRRGIATIEPQMSVDARIQQMTADRTLASLPKALQHVSLFEPTGPLVDANRGLLEFSDLLKRPVEAFKYLLSTVETATVSMDSFMLHLDMMFIASTNETYLDAFKEHPDFPSFKGRIELIKVPYLVRYASEREIYEQQTTERVVGKHVAPHAINVAALWAVLTRMRRSDHTRYSKEISDVIDSLTPLEKLHLYDTGEIPERLTTREAKELRHLIPDLYRESLAYPNYEGRFGASAREIRTVLLNAAHHPEYTCLSPLAVLEEIERLLENKSVYEFLKQEVVGRYHDHEAFLRQTRDIYTDWIDDEVRDSMGLASEESYADLFNRYVQHISHWVKHERIADAVSGRLLDPDEKFMGEIEGVLMGEGERPEDFRKSVIGAIGARALDNPDEMPEYASLFRGYVNRLRDDFFTKRRKVVRRIIRNFLKFTPQERSSLEAKDARQAEEMLKRLIERYHYNEESARDAVAYLVKTRYAE